LPVPSPTGTAIVASRSPAAPIDPRADGLDVAFGEFAITLEADVIRPGPVTLVVHNAGHLAHGLEMKIEASGSGNDRKRIETRTFRPGETLRVEANLPPGVYEIECYVADHAEKGMRTTLEVRADAPLVAAAPGTAVPGNARIVQFAFVAASLDVPAGTRVTWMNDDPAPHTVTADGGAFDSRQLDPGASFSVVLDTPGVFAYHCEIHPTMVGTVVVH
jgi:plastocyanin